jgi:hypothetical protein
VFPLLSCFHLTRQVSCLVRVPTEVTKSRTQTGAYGEGKGKGSINSALSIWRFEGLRGFYRGFGMTIVRDVRIKTVSLCDAKVPRFLSPRSSSPCTKL